MGICTLVVKKQNAGDLFQVQKQRNALTTGWSASILFSISLDEDEQTAVTMLTTTSHLEHKPVHSSVHYSQPCYSQQEFNRTLK